MTTPEVPVLARGRLRPLRLLGEGGVGKVWLAYDERLEVYRAVKVLARERTENAQLRTRFDTEARIQAQLRHPNVVQVYDIGDEADQVYFVMEWVPGGSLWELLSERGRLHPHHAADIGIGILAGLEAAHARNIIHRDIKPHNVLLTTDGVPKLADFGVAHLQPEERGDVTRTGVIMGTWNFMAPEQRASARRVTPASDVYSTGATLYSLLTGRLETALFDQDEKGDVFARVPDALRPVVVKATRYAPQERYPDATSMRLALQEARDRIGAPVPPPLAIPARVNPSQIRAATLVPSVAQAPAPPRPTPAPAPAPPPAPAVPSPRAAPPASPASPPVARSPAPVRTPAAAGPRRPDPAGMDLSGEAGGRIQGPAMELSLSDAPRDVGMSFGGDAAPAVPVAMDLQAEGGIPSRQPRRREGSRILVVGLALVGLAALGLLAHLLGGTTSTPVTPPDVTPVPTPTQPTSITPDGTPAPTPPAPEPPPVPPATATPAAPVVTPVAPAADARAPVTAPPASRGETPPKATSPGTATTAPAQVADADDPNDVDDELGIGPDVGAAISKVVQQKRGDLLSCHAARMEAGSASTGFLMVRTTLARGQVKGTEVTANTTGDGDLATCVGDAVKGWQFPDFVDGVQSVRAQVRSEETMLWAADRVVRQKTGTIDAACTRSLPGGTNLLGTRVVLQLHVASGEVTAASVKSDSTGVTGLAACVAEAARSWAFPAWVTTDLTVAKGW